MQKKIAKLLQERLEELGFDVRYHDRYSGRCMYGETTHAISGEFSDSDIAVAACGLFDDGDAQDAGLVPGGFTFVTDNLGLGTIYY